MFQESSWFFRLLDPATGSFNVARAWTLCGAVDPAVLQQALDAIAIRHDILRSQVVVDDGQYMVLDTERRLVCQVTDLSTRDAATASTLATTFLENEFARQFDFESDPLVRVHLLRLARERSVLMVIKPHLITDDTSMSLFITELATHYSAIRSGNRLSLARPPQFTAFAEWQREFCDSPAAAAHMNFWGGLLTAAPAAIGLPKCDVTAVTHASRYLGGEAKFWLSDAVLDPLNAMRRDQHATLYVVLLAAFAVLLQRICRQDDIVVGSLISNRVRPDTRSIIGPVVNTFALRFQLAGSTTFSDVLGLAGNLVTNAYRYSDMPFERVIRDLKGAGRLDHIFRLNAVFDYFASAPREPTFPGVKATPLAVRRNRSQVGLTLKVWPESSGLAMCFEYQRAHFSDADIERVYAHYAAILSEMARSPQSTIREAHP